MARDVYDELAAAREVIQQADEILGYKLSKLMFEGPSRCCDASSCQTTWVLPPVTASASTPLS
jgi:hypothetical protein